jgi:hypothetical protein
LVAFENNTFEDNVGIEGGAIHIQRNQNEGLIYFKNNTFLRNMAYIDGNAIVLRD